MQLNDLLRKTFENAVQSRIFYKSQWTGFRSVIANLLQQVAVNKEIKVVERAKHGDSGLHYLLVELPNDDSKIYCEPWVVESASPYLPPEDYTLSDHELSKSETAVALMKLLLKAGDINEIVSLLDHPQIEVSFDQYVAASGMSIPSRVPGISLRHYLFVHSDKFYQAVLSYSESEEILWMHRNDADFWRKQLTNGGCNANHA